MKKAIWMSFDLGVKGDYEGIYRWLDQRGARECSGMLAFFSYKAKADVASELKKSLNESVELDSKARIYIIFLGKDKKMKGRFLFGNRKAAPWTGFAPAAPEEDDNAS